MQEPLDLIAATAFGLEAVVVRELADLGYESKPVSTGRVAFRAGPEAVVRANLWLRAADRVLIQVGRFAALDFGVLFDATRALPWERWIAPDGDFPVNGRSVRSQLSSVPACQRIVKKAIVERLREAHGVELLPETGAPVVVEVSMLEDAAVLTIDTSGAGLHKRGYRPVVGEAAMKETLAAALVLLSAWRPGRPLIDPFCGSGTIAIEAAMIARRMAPGLKRVFDAEKWAAIAPDLWAAGREEARGAIRPAPEPVIEGSDVDEAALALARRGAGAAGVAEAVRFVRRDFKDLASEAEYGCIITNPPYGVRLGEEAEIERLYQTMPLVLRRLPTWSFHILTARQDLERLVGQPAARRRKLFNSQIECTYYTFFGPRPPSGPLRDEAGGEAAREVAEPVAAERSGVETETVSVAVPVAGPIAVERVEAPPAFGGLRERDARELEIFRNCLANNVRHLRKWPSRGITCYRLYERDVPDVPLIIDRYEDCVHVAEYEREHSRTVAQQADWIDAARRIIAECTGAPPENVFIKEKRRQRGLSQHERQGDAGVTRVAREAGLKFEINLTDYIDTGLFLDHRQTRAMVRDAAGSGKRFLNLFCYTGSFTVYAAAGGASATTSVDLSNTYLEWAQRNLALNGFWPGPHRLVRSDVLEFLRTHARGPHYDLAVMDPPTFSNSKSTQEDWEVGESHKEALRLLSGIMSPGGAIFFSNNYRRFKLDEEMLAEVGLRVQEMTHRTIPVDFRNKRIHRCWRILTPISPGAAGS